MATNISSNTQYTTACKCSWSSLPKDLLQHTSRFLTVSELGLSILACKNWHHVFNDNDFIWNWQAQRVGASKYLPIQTLLSDRLEKMSDECHPEIVDLIAEYIGHPRTVQNAKQMFVNPNPYIAFGKEQWIQYFGCDPGKIPPFTDKYLRNSSRTLSILVWKNGRRDTSSYINA